MRLTAPCTAPPRRPKKKPTWPNTLGRSTTSAYSSTSLPANRAALYLVVRQIQLKTAMAELRRKVDRRSTGRLILQCCPGKANQMSIMFHASDPHRRCSPRVRWQVTMLPETICAALPNEWPAQWHFRTTGRARRPANLVPTREQRPAIRQPGPWEPSPPVSDRARSRARRAGAP